VFTELFLVFIGSLGFCDGGFVRAELMVDYLPNHFVVLHGGKLLVVCRDDSVVPYLAAACLETE
jgi:hypothetical protein